MSLPLAIPDSLWPSLVGALFGSLFASGSVAYLTQRWTEQRERRNRRDDLRLDLYLEVVDLILADEEAVGDRGTEGAIPPVDLQLKQLRISHRLKLLGSPSVRDAYRQYHHFVFQEIAHPIGDRPKDPDQVVHAREALIDLMAKDI